MLRIVRSCLALVLLASVLALLPAARVGAQEATPAATPLMKPQPPTQPTTGPGSSETLFDSVTAIKQGPPDQFFC